MGTAGGWRDCGERRVRNTSVLSVLTTSVCGNPPRVTVRCSSIPAPAGALSGMPLHLHLPWLAPPPGASLTPT